MIEKIEHAAMLYDFYGSLLTDRQRDILSLYYEQDLSLGEIAQECDISRQAVHDLLKRTEKILEDYEKKLNLIKKYYAEHDKLSEVLDLLHSGEQEPLIREKVKKIVNDIMMLHQND